MTSPTVTPAGPEARPLGRDPTPGPLHVAVTGAAGFVGRHLVAHLLGRGHRVTCITRKGGRPCPVAGAHAVEAGDLAREGHWPDILAGVDAVVHLAARVHVMDDRCADPLASYRRVNVEGTRRLAEGAIAAGVGRFVFLSTIKVNGERTPARPFRADDPPAPEGPYAVSKLEAEQQLWSLSATGGTGFVVIRPPLVYGPGVRGNLGRLIAAVDRGWPLPLGSLDQPRTLVAVDNLVDLIERCLSHPDAPGEVFLAGDAEDWSSAGLVRAIAAELGRPARLLPVPPALLRAAAAVAGKRPLADRLCSPLRVDLGKNRERLQWVPPHAAGAALAGAVRAAVPGPGHG